MTKYLYGLLGHPLGHSFSAAYFSNKFQELGASDHAYIHFDLPSLDLIHDVLEAHPELKGFNVTIPYKEQIIPLLDGLDAEAKLIGSINCVKISENGERTGYNTDAYGFYHSIKPFLENKYERALILGTGGSAKAVSYVLKKLGIKVFFATRNPRESYHLHYSEITENNIAFFPLIVNCTPVGMAPNIDSIPPLPYNALTSDHFLYDLIYNPEETLFLRKGKEAGATVANGKLMLQLQAEKSWQIWKSL